MTMYCYQGSSEMEAADGLQTLYLMNPNYNTSDTRHHMMMPHAPPPQFHGLSHYDKPTPSTGDFSSSLSSSQSHVIIMGSKYLKAAQQLLDEVANVGNITNIYKPNIIKNHTITIGDGGGGADLTTSERQDIQMKKAKLNSMLHEVEQRYKQYQEEMRIVVASFEQVAGVGSAKSYTELALNTFLKHFKRLRASISAQIKALSKSLGEEEGKMKGSRLVRFVDHHHHYNNAWRPQRGLPEKAVSVLRAWLFDHFLHPYPMDSDKHMLAKQTGLTRSQVSNWFINARVRLWKPMVEEMYHEEMKNQQQLQINSHEGDQEINTTVELSQCSKTNSQRQKKARIFDHEPTKNALQSNLILNLENVAEKNPRKDNSPSSILSDLQTSIGINNNVKYFSNYDQIIEGGDQIGMLHVNDQQQQQRLGMANSFSLSLGLLPSQGAHQHSFITRINGVDHNQPHDFLPDFNWWRQRL